MVSLSVSTATPLSHSFALPHRLSLFHLLSFFFKSPRSLTLLPHALSSPLALWPSCVLAVGPLLPCLFQCACLFQEISQVVFTSRDVWVVSAGLFRAQVQVCMLVGGIKVGLYLHRRSPLSHRVSTVENARKMTWIILQAA